MDGSGGCRPFFMSGNPFGETPRQEPPLPQMDFRVFPELSLAKG
jgi:hypothetical protein